MAVIGFSLSAADRVKRGPKIFLEHLLVVAVAETVGVLVPVLERIGPKRRRLPAVGVIDQKRDRRKRMAAIGLVWRDAQEAIDEFSLGR